MDYSSAYLNIIRHTNKPLSRAEAITSAAVKAATDLLSPMIVCLTETGSSARFVAKYKPAMPVVTLTPNEQTARQCMVSRALHPVFASRDARTEEALLKLAIALGKTEQWLSAGDPVVMVSGMNQGVAGSTNTLRILDA